MNPKFEVKTECMYKGGQYCGMKPMKMTVHDPESGISISVENIYSLGRSQTKIRNNFSDAIELLRSI